MQTYLLKVFIIVFMLVSIACSYQKVSAMLGIAQSQGPLTDYYHKMGWIESAEDEFTRREDVQLAKAAAKGYLNKIDLWVENGADVNALGKNSRSIICWSFGEFESYKKLIDLGANPNGGCRMGTAMHWAARFPDVRYLEYALANGGQPDIIENEFNETPIFKTITITGDFSRQRALLIESGANIDAKTKTENRNKTLGGVTPIMTAAELNRYDIVYELLENGANYRIKDNQNTGLAERLIHSRKVMKKNTDAWTWSNKVIDWLAERGVEIEK